LQVLGCLVQPSLIYWSEDFSGGIDQSRRSVSGRSGNNDFFIAGTCLVWRGSKSIAEAELVMVALMLAAIFIWPGSPCRAGAEAI